MLMLYTLSEHRIKLCEVAFANRLLHEKGGHKFDGALGGLFFSPTRASGLCGIPSPSQTTRASPNSNT